MKRTHLMAVMGLGLALAGCSSEKKTEAGLARVGDEAAPDFVAGAPSVLLTNLDGFSAHVEEAYSTNQTERTVSGELIERQGRLIFEPATTANLKKGKIIRGGMYFIWDTHTQSGYVLSEALQGYAPIFPLVAITNAAVTRESGSEEVNGHPCHRVEAVVGLSDGSAVRVMEWQADDLGRFPVRLQAMNAMRQVTVDFSDVRLDLASPELFTPPAVFTKYASATALINELMIREASLKKGPTGEMGEPNVPPENGWRPPSVAR